MNEFEKMQPVSETIPETAREPVLSEAPETVSDGTSGAASEADAGSRPVKERFQPDRTDAIFALFAFVLGYLFSRWVFFSWQGWGVTVFTVLFLGGVALYLSCRGRRLHGEAWFWLVAALAVALSFALWNGEGIWGIRALALFGFAVYFVLSASGALLAGGTGNYVLLDGLNALLFIPFRNFFNQYVSFTALRRHEGRRGRVAPVLMGAALSAALLALVLPRLLRADSGGFARILRGATNLVQLQWGAEFFVYAIPAVPVALYLFALVSGAAHRRHTETLRVDRVEKAAASMRVLPHVSVYIALGVLCGVYAVFIFSQVPYFFSAFTGARPEGYPVYAEYARDGFFELCQIGAINLAALLAANVLCKKTRMESGALRALNIAVSAITLVLIATAFSKMALYIHVYGLSVPRILPCVFMAFMAGLCAGVIALQKRRFSIARFGLLLGAALLTVTCLANPDGITVRYNTGRYLAGTLSAYDVDILYRAGDAGVLPALEVWLDTEDPALKARLEAYLTDQAHAYTHEQTVERALALRAVNSRGPGAGP